MKKVLHITFDMRIGGTEQVIKNLIEGTDRGLYDVSILCLECPPGPFGELLQKQGITIDSISRKEGFDTGLIFRIRHYIKKRNINILHCHQYTPWVYGALASFMTGIKVIFTEHGRFYPDSSSWKRRLINPILYRLTDKATTISGATKQALVDYEFLPEDKIQVIYNGIAPLNMNSSQVTGIRSSLGLSDSTRVIGTIARLDPIKNQLMMLQAFELVLKNCPNTNLLIVGDGEEMGNLKNMAMKLKISEKVIFTGYITDPTNYLELMDIFLLSSLSEGTSMTLLEAMSLGKPCVVTDAGGNPEIITHEVNGVVTPNNDAAPFADAIIDLLLDDKKYQRQSAASSDCFKERFDLEFMTKEYQQIYQKL